MITGVSDESVSNKPLSVQTLLVVINLLFRLDEPAVTLSQYHLILINMIDNDTDLY